MENETILEMREQYIGLKLEIGEFFQYAKSLISCSRLTPSKECSSL